MTDKSHSILPLHPEVAAQIKSSTVVPSLTGVVFGLICNSLDAQAHRIDVSVDFRRGAVSVEDNGYGIPPKEFAETGGLGKPYHTSRNHSSNATYGKNGTFLPSVAALSILTITSHHYAHMQHATLILHRSRPAARLVPAPPHHNLSYREQGTRVAVQDLFGNMPVRLKQRAAGSKNREDGKQLSILKRQIVGLLLAWHKPVFVSLRSAEGGVKLLIRDNQDMTSRELQEEGLFRSFDLPLVRGTLSQAGYIDPSGWNDWIKTSAQTPFVTIKGAISLQAAPSKQVQFMSLGIIPIDKEVANSVLYEEVNRLFASSSFGSQQNVSDTESLAELKRSKDRRFKQDGFTTKQLKGGGKGVDRWPMFYIRIELQQCTRQGLAHSAERLGEGTLSCVLKVLGAMITNFLDEHHFRPRARTKRREQGAPKKQNDVASSPGPHRSDEKLHLQKGSQEQYRDHSFSAWGRIKIGTHVIRPATSSCLYSTQNPGSPTKVCERGATDPGLEPVVALEPQKAIDNESSDIPSNPDREQKIEWKDPISGAIVFINARTGLVVNSHLSKRPASAPSGFGTTAVFKHARRLTRSISQFVSPRANCWSSELLNQWQNPVFDTTAESIPQVSFGGPSVETKDILHGRRHCCSNVDIQKAFTQSSSSFSARLSKAALKNARLISQVDKKFILVCISDREIMRNERGELLVLIDQHAADERIRVEGLLADLSSSPTVLVKPILFDVQAREHDLLARHVAYFAEWNILYELNVPSTSPKCRVSVKALPPPVAERCRIEPKVLIELLRAEAWKREEDGGFRTAKNCPQGLLDMLNSRACRSAIMFNDELTIEEAQTLVQRLGECAFPFQCAHGRPSMIPLVDLGASSSFGITEKAFGVGSMVGNGFQQEERAFGEAWKMWKPNV